MKTIFTCYAIFSFVIMVSAQETVTEVQVSLVEMNKKNEGHLKTPMRKEQSVTRLYLLKNSRVKKELSFRTKRNRSKLV